MNVTPITPALLAQMEQGYQSRPDLTVLSNAISRTDLDDAAFVPAAAAKLRMDFSVTVPTTGITNQKKSGRCWMFSVLNALREEVIRGCGLESFAFSASYMAFYDKLEKCNLFYENILHFAGQELTDRETWTLLGSPLPDGGQWDMVASLVRKYGVVPEWVMPENVHSSGTAQYRSILERKLRKDALELRELARAGKDTAARRAAMLQEDYNALCILYGQPPKTFDFEYTDKDKHYHCDRGLTPQAFFAKYVHYDFDAYLPVISSPIHEMNRTYCQPFMGDVVEENMFWLNLSQEELEELTVRQLQAGEPGAKNVLPAKARLSGTVRTFDEGVRDKIFALMEQMVQNTCALNGCTGVLERQPMFPSLSNDPKVTALVCDPEVSPSLESPV